MDIRNFFKNIFNLKNEPVEPILNSKRFPFGDILEYNGKTYRYLYTTGDIDVFFNEENITICTIKSKFVLPH